MDKTIWLIMVAVVAVVVAVFVLFMVQGQTNSFTEFISGESETAQCDLWKSRINNCEAVQSDAPQDLQDSDSCTLPSQPAECG